MNNKLTLGFGLGLLAVLLAGARVTLEDEIKFGDPNTTSSKKLTFDRGSGANNPEISVDGTGQLQFKNDSGSLVDFASANGVEVLTNKDFDGGTATDQSRITLPSETTSNLAGLTRKEGTIAYDTDKNYPVYDNGAAFLDLVTPDASQVLTNKDIDGGTASNTSRLTLPKNSTANLSSLTRKQGNIFYDTDLDSIVIDDGSALNVVGSGSGGTGEINYIDNPGFEDDTAGYSLYADAPGSQPVDGTGGVPARLTLARVLGNDLSDTAYLQLDFDGVSSARGEGFSYDFTVDNAQKDAQKKMLYSFQVDATDANYATGDMIACMFETSGPSLLQVEGSEALDGTNGACQFVRSGNQVHYFVFNADNATNSYRMTIHYAQSIAKPAMSLKFDNFRVAPLGFEPEHEPGERDGFVPKEGLLGFADGSTAASNRVGHYDEVVLGSPYSCSSTSFEDVTTMSLTLTAGRWLIGYSVSATANRTSGTADNLIAIREGASTVLSDSVSPFGFNGSPTVVERQISNQVYRSISATTTYKLSILCGNATEVMSIESGSANASLTDPDTSSKIYAIRL